MIQTDYFKRVTGYDLTNFFNNFGLFVENHYGGLVNYFSGSGDLRRDSVRILDNLLAEADKIEDIFNLNREAFSTDVSYWDLYEYFNDIMLKLQTIKNTPKWVRASYVDDYDRNTNIEYILKQGQSVENLTDQLGYPVPDDDWVEIAIKNKLKELDYNSSGGNLLSVTFSVNTRYNSLSVVDIMTGENILGKDIYNTVTIEDDDLKALPPKETIFQSAEILISITKGSVPEFPKDGLENIAGSNMNMVRYPAIFRELVNLFRKDDTFREIEIIDVSKDQDKIKLDVRIVSKLNDVLEQNIYLNV